MQFHSNAENEVSAPMRMLCLLWLGGTAMRITILAVPPLIPLIHDDLRMTETQVGFLGGLPLLVFAVAAVPGSLLVVPLGVGATLLLCRAIPGLSAGGRRVAVAPWRVYAPPAAMGS